MSEEEKVVAPESSVVPAPKPEETPKKRYFGLKEIVSEATTEDGKIVSFLLKDDTSVNIPAWEAKCLVSDAPWDYQTLRNERANVVAQKLLEVLLEHDYPVQEVGFMLQKVSDSLFDKHTPGTYHRAINRVVSKATNGVVNTLDELRLGDIEEFLTAK